MSAPHHNSEQPTLIVRLLTSPLYYLLRYRWATLLVAGLLGLGSIIYTLSCLGYKSGRNDLVATDRDYNQRWLAYCRDFGDQDDAVIVIEAPAREQVLQVTRRVAAELAKAPQLYQAVLHEEALLELRSRGLHYLSRPEIERIAAGLQQSTPIIQGQWSQLRVSTTLQSLLWRLKSLPPTATTERSALLADLQRYTGALLTALQQPSGQLVSPWPAGMTSLPELNSESLLSTNGRQGLILLRLDRGSDKLAPYNESTTALRTLLADMKRDFPQAILGLTGLPVMENDEMRASQSSMIWASVISFIGVVLVIVAAFGGVRHALLANLVLLLGMSWAFGYATFAVGHLNILSVTFTATLIGIGIDYGTYYVSRYLQLRGQGLDPTAAVFSTSAAVGPGILTGAVTTAISFFAAAWTSFPGVAELGIIAGGGLLLCAAAQLFVLPVCLVVWDSTQQGSRLPVSLPLQQAFTPFWRRPRMVALAGMVVTLVLGMGLPNLWYDYNLLNLQANDLDSVVWEKKLLAASGRSVWYGISITDSPAELMRRKAAFAKQPNVERTEEIFSLLPAPDPVRQQLIAQIAGSLEHLPQQSPLIVVDQLNELGPQLAVLQGELQQSPDTVRVVQDLEQLRILLKRITPGDCYQRLSQFQQFTAQELLVGLNNLKQVAQPLPPTLANLPASLVQRFVADQGERKLYLLKVYGRGDIWDMSSLEQFVQQVRAVDPQITGNPLQAYEASREMRTSFEQASVYALGIILIVLWLDFRSVTYSLLAALPLGLSLLQTFGLLGWLNQPLNPANMIALPLIMGIGVDYGVHIVHNFLEQPRGSYRMTPATVLAIGVDALTTIIGFGSLMIASHQGLYSLGRVLTLGITFCTLTSLVLLPIILRWCGQWSEHWAAKSATLAELEELETSAFIDDERPLVLPVKSGSTGKKSPTLHELMASSS